MRFALPYRARTTLCTAVHCTRSSTVKQTASAELSWFKTSRQYKSAQYVPHTNINETVPVHRYMCDMIRCCTYVLLIRIQLSHTCCKPPLWSASYSSSTCTSRSMVPSFLIVHGQTHLHYTRILRGSSKCTYYSCSITCSS